MIRFFGVIAFALFCLCAGAADVSTEFDAANRLYEKGDYAAAARAYSKIADGGRASAALWFNLGNAWFKDAQMGRAIWAYRNAQQLAPRDPDIRANLKFARSAAPGNDIRSSPLDRALELLTINERGVWTGLSLWICFGALALAQLRPEWKNSLKLYAVGAGVFTICFGAWFTQGLIKRATERKVVVVAPTAAVRFGPLEESQISFNVRDGNELRMIGRKDAWFQVADQSNRSGWIPAAQILPLP